MLGGALSATAGGDGQPTRNPVLAGLPMIRIGEELRDDLDRIPYAISPGEPLGDWLSRLWGRLGVRCEMQGDPGGGLDIWLRDAGAVDHETEQRRRRSDDVRSRQGAERQQPGRGQHGGPRADARPRRLARQSRRRRRPALRRARLGRDRPQRGGTAVGRGAPPGGIRRRQSTPCARRNHRHDPPARAVAGANRAPRCGGGNAARRRRTGVVGVRVDPRRGAMAGGGGRASLRPGRLLESDVPRKDRRGVATGATARSGRVDHLGHRRRRCFRGWRAGRPGPHGTDTRALSVCP